MTRDRLSLWRIARTARQGLVLGLAFVGAQLRRLPGAGLVGRFLPLIVAVLLVGALRLTGSEPVLVVRAAGGEVTLGFASTDDRDGAYAARVASVATRPTRSAR